MNQPNDSFVVSVSKGTVIYRKNGHKGTFDDLTTGSRVSVAGVINDQSESMFDVTSIHILGASSSAAPPS
jgi:hypothetical protein